jgi:hypothetical protein
MAPKIPTTRATTEEEVRDGAPAAAGGAEVAAGALGAGVPVDVGVVALLLGGTVVPGAGVEAPGVGVAAGGGGGDPAALEGGGTWI